MSHNPASTSSLGRATVVPAGLQSFLTEIGNLMGVMLSPGRLIRDVEAMGKLLRQASQIESKNPEGAAALRRQAARVVR
jgi:hypothetical protein